MSRRLIRTLATSLLLALLGSPVVAFGETPRTTIVVLTPIHSEESAEIAAEQFAQGKYFRAISLATLVPLLRQDDEQKAVHAKVGDARERARQALLALNHEQAQKHLNDALQVLQSSFIGFYDPRLLADLHVLRGVVALRLSRPDLAREEFLSAAQHDPSLKLDAHYSPQVRDAFRDALASAAQSPAYSAEQLGRLVRLAPNARYAVVIVAEHHAKGPNVLRALVFDSKAGRFTSVESQSLAESDDQRRINAASLGRRVCVELDNKLAPPVTVSPPGITTQHENGTTSGNAPKPTAAPPWYKRWYVWAAAAAIVGAAGAAVAFSVRRDTVDLTAQWQP